MSNAAMSTPGPQVRAATMAATTAADALAEAHANTMTIGFKEEAEPIGTPVMDDFGFSAMTMDAIQNQRNKSRNTKTKTGSHLDSSFSNAMYVLQ